MNELEATRAKLKCLEMVDGTELDWWTVVCHVGSSKFTETPRFNDFACNYEFALGVVEGKPVWEGDKLYLNGECVPTTIDAGHNLPNVHWSWFPPKPATLMVELPIEDVEFWNNLGEFFCFKNKDAYEIASSRFYKSCKKALEQLK